ncbi:type II and III secretion system protein [Crateriforma spongiae]|uniref:type II and III secretion system protein n=1 Tax=Crateriforma spongiae TaxID=2724528 RepID=UPI001447BC21|nr:type II and III secretion system protein [Crateriforma spongiae]
MRWYAFCAVFILCLPAVADDHADMKRPTLQKKALGMKAAEKKAAESELSVYEVTVASHRLTEAVDPDLSNTEILQWLGTKEGQSNVQSTTTLRQSCVQGMKSSVQFGRQVAVVEGEVSTGRGVVSKRMERYSVGSMCQCIIKPQGKQLLLEIDVEHSLVDEADDESMPPEIRSQTISTTIIVAPGQPVVIGGDDQNVMVLTVR